MLKDEGVGARGSRDCEVRKLFVGRDGGNFRTMPIEQAKTYETKRPRTFVTGSLGDSRGGSGKEGKRVWGGKAMTPAFLSKKNSEARVLTKPIFSRSSRKKESIVVIDSKTKRAND